MKFEDMINTITLGDSYKLIKYIPDNSIDLVVIDPPYLFDNFGGGCFLYIKHARPKDKQGLLLRRLRAQHRGDRSPSPGGNLPSNRYLTRWLYSLQHCFTATL